MKLWLIMYDDFTCWNKILYLTTITTTSAFPKTPVTPIAIVMAVNTLDSFPIVRQDKSAGVVSFRTAFSEALTSIVSLRDALRHCHVSGTILAYKKQQDVSGYIIKRGALTFIDVVLFVLHVHMIFSNKGHSHPSDYHSHRSAYIMFFDCLMSDTLPIVVKLGVSVD